MPEGTFFASGVADAVDLDDARRLSPGERLERLNELMLRAEQIRIAA